MISINFDDDKEYAQDVLDSIYNEVYEVINKNDLKQSLKALSYAKQMHNGQYRKGKAKIPYIYHPLVVARQAISLGFIEDEIIATALLHDVCEDCDVDSWELPVGEEVKKSVKALTKDSNLYQLEFDAEKKYYDGISQNKYACIVKVLDRCNNISDMVGAFSKEKMLDYIENTKFYIYPLFDSIEKEYTEYQLGIWSVKYHIASTIKAIEKLTN